MKREQFENSGNSACDRDKKNMKMNTMIIDDHKNVRH